MEPGSIAAIVVAVIALVPSLLLYARERRKTEAESTDIVTGAAIDLVKQLKIENSELRAHVTNLETDVNRLKTDIAQLRACVEELRRGAKRLQGQIESMGQPPVWTVPAEPYANGSSR